MRIDLYTFNSELNYKYQIFETFIITPIQMIWSIVSIQPLNIAYFRQSMELIHS